MRKSIEDSVKYSVYLGELRMNYVAFFVTVNEWYNIRYTLMKYNIYREGAQFIKRTHN